MKLMVPQHAVKYHEARDWIHLQDQDILRFQSLLNYCTQQEARCKQCQQVQVQDRAQLTTITVASVTPSFLHTNMQSTTTNISCKRCGYTHPCTNCPVFDCECYNCHNKGNFTALCRKPRTNRCQTNAPCRSSSRSRSTRSSSRRHNRSLSRGRQPHRRSQSSHRGSSNSISPSQDCHDKRSPRHGRCSSTPYRNQVSHLTSSIFQSQVNEGQLYTDMAQDGHQLFHMTLQLITKQSCKPLSVKVTPGADANIIPLSQYGSIFLQHFHSNRTLKVNSLRKIRATWSLHDGKTHHFSGFFTVDVQHKTKCDIIPISFYVFKDSTRPSTLISYSTSIHLGLSSSKSPMKPAHMQ